MQYIKYFTSSHYMFPATYKSKHNTYCNWEVSGYPSLTKIKHMKCFKQYINWRHVKIYWATPKPSKYTGNIFLFLQEYSWYLRYWDLSTVEGILWVAGRYQPPGFNYIFRSTIDTFINLQWHHTYVIAW